MKSVIAVMLGFALILTPIFSFAQASEPLSKPSCADLQRLGAEKFQELGTLPVGISVIHDPASVEAVQNQVSRWPYKWSYSTSVSSLGGDIEIKEFGTLSWNGSTWSLANYTGAPFTNSDFSSWYSCSRGLLSSGTVYSDRTNWSANLELKENLALWYFIGVDASGQRVKGQAIVHQVARLQAE